MYKLTSWLRRDSKSVSYLSIYNWLGYHLSVRYSSRLENSANIYINVCFVVFSINLLYDFNLLRGTCHLNMYSIRAYCSGFLIYMFLPTLLFMYVISLYLFRYIYAKSKPPCKQYTLSLCFPFQFLLNANEHIRVEK